MSIIDRILGRAPGAGTPITVTPGASRVAGVPTPVATPPATPPAAGEGSEPPIRVYDQFGRTVQMGRESWRKDVLLPNLAANRDKPDALFDLIVGALNDDFAADVLESARHLAATDPRPPRGVTLLGAVLLQLGDFPGAREVLERALARHADDAHLLANLARACAALGDEERAQKLIWLALSLAPNDESSLHWLITLANARGGQRAALAAYGRAALLPGSWRAQLWLARHALEQGDPAEAERLYEEALGRARPVPADLLMQMSGDLGSRGHTQLLVQITQPRFDVALHGLLVGNNLLRAFIELGRLSEARKLLEQLYAQQRPDWREHLQFWERKLDEAERRFGEVTAPLEVVVVKFDQPVWAQGALDFASLLPARAASARRVHFVCGSGESGDDAGGKVVSQPTNDLGRLTRALPLFLAEEVYLRTDARPCFLLPWMKQGGFVLSGRRWTRDFLPREGEPPDLVVFLHVDARRAPWSIELRLERPDGAATILRRDFDPGDAGEAVLALLRDVLARLGDGTAPGRTPGVALETPEPAEVPGYLAACEQAMAVALAARHDTGPSFLHQERAIFDHLFDVALRSPKLLRPRLLLVNALEHEARRRPDLAAEYLGKLTLLQERHALPADEGTAVLARGVQALFGKVA